MKRGGRMKRRRGLNRWDLAGGRWERWLPGPIGYEN
jgi:hypothetical protein